MRRVNRRARRCAAERLAVLRATTVKEYGELKLVQAERLEGLGKIQRLKKWVAPLSLDKAVLEDMAIGSFQAPSDADRLQNEHRVRDAVPVN